MCLLQCYYSITLDTCWNTSHVAATLHTVMRFDCTVIWRSLTGPVQQTRPLGEWDQKILTHPNFQVEGNCKLASTWVNIVLARINLLSTRGPRWAEKFHSSGASHGSWKLFDSSALGWKVKMAIKYLLVLMDYVGGFLIKGRFQEKHFPARTKLIWVACSLVWIVFTLWLMLYPVKNICILLLNEMYLHIVITNDELQIG